MSMEAFTVQRVMPMGSGGFIPDLPEIPDTPDAAEHQAGRQSTPGGGIVDFGGLVDAFRTVTPALENAGRAEKSFISGHGNLLEMALERAKADTLLSLASATASKATQAASTLMNLQV